MKTPNENNYKQQMPTPAGFPLINFGNNQIVGRNISKEQLQKHNSKDNTLALWEFDVEFSKTYYSSEFIGMFGYTREEFEAFKSCCFITHVIHPADIKKAVEFLSRIKNNELEEFQFTARMKHKNGDYLWACYIGSVSEFDDNGIPSIYSGIIKIVDEVSVIEKEQFNYKLAVIQQKHERKEKEQELMYAILALLNNSRSINYTLQSIVDRIEQTYHVYTNASTKLVFDGLEFSSPQYCEEETYLFSTFETFSGKKGSVIFHYDMRLVRNNDPSHLNEISGFMNAMVDSIKNWLNKKETESEFRNMFVQLESKVEDKTQELKNVNKKLLAKNKDMNDSINYANHIQRAILPESDIIAKEFIEAFVFYKPKDVVSGDFYWFHTEGDKIFYACADCTGHGVPGALMSMVGNQLLTHIIADEKVTNPSEILKQMDLAILKLFRKSNVTFNLRDGMSISLCVIDKKEKTLSFAGAYNNAYIFRSDELVTLEADRHSIGGSDSMEGNDYTKTVVKYSQGDQLYMFTDGLPDQFGGANGKKLMRKRLLDFIDKMKHNNMCEQREIIEELFIDWKGENFQVDDVTLLGVKL